jgi:hypothetical protein
MLRKIIGWRPPLMTALVALVAAVVPATGLPAHVGPVAAAVLAVVRGEHPDSPPVTARARARGARSFRAA